MKLTYWRMRRVGRLFPLLLLTVLPFVVNSVALADWLSANPIHWMSGLNVVRPNTHLLIRGFPGWVDGNAGVTTQALGHLAAERWLQGIVPWWNEFSGIGMPLAAEMQNSALFFPFVLLLHFSNGLIFLKTVLEAIGGLGMYAFTRQLGIDSRAALIGATLFEFNGTFAWFSHGPIMPVPFLPWLLFGIERARVTTQHCRSGGWEVIAVAIAFSVVAGFPETAYLDGLLGLTFSVYRVVTLGPGRVRLTGKIFVGGAVGLLISAPASVPFVEFASSGYVGPHVDFSSARLLAQSYALLLFPYIYGPILYGNEMIGEPADIWWHTGGYCSLVSVFLAILALVRQPGRDLGLRYVLAGWVLLTLAKAAGVQPMVALLDIIPLIRQTMFFNYITPSWQLVLAVLGSYALHDWHACSLPSAWERRAPSLAVAICLLVAIAALYEGSGEINELSRSIPRFFVYPVAAIVWTIASTLVLARLLSRDASHYRSLAVGSVLGMTCLILYGLPLLSGTRDDAMNERPIAFLRQHLGLSRFYAAPDPEPNYSAYYEVASINHNYLPVPQNWVDFLHSRVNPTLDGVEFHGSGLTASSGVLAEEPSPTSSAISVADILQTYEDLAVQYLILPADSTPFSDWAAPGIAPVRQRAFPLANGQGFQARLASSQVATGVVEGVGLQIGTYAGHSRGVLSIELCNGSDCARGSIDVKKVSDNAIASLRLDHPLPMVVGQALTAHISFTGSSPIAVWLWPQTAASGIIGPDVGHPNYIPYLLLRRVPRDAALRLVYRDAQFKVLELPRSKAYFSTLLGRCHLSPVSRFEVTADCSSADTLIRRELFFPGWHAVASDTEQPISAYDDILEATSLSQGHHSIKFYYQPTGIVFCYLSFGIGTLVLLGQIGAYLVTKRCEAADHARERGVRRL